MRVILLSILLSLNVFHAYAGSKSIGDLCNFSNILLSPTGKFLYNDVRDASSFRAYFLDCVVSDKGNDVCRLKIVYDDQSIFPDQYVFSHDDSALMALVAVVGNEGAHGGRTISNYTRIARIRLPPSNSSGSALGETLDLEPFLSTPRMAFDLLGHPDANKPEFFKDSLVRAHKNSSFYVAPLPVLPFTNIYGFVDGKGYYFVHIDKSYNAYSHMNGEKTSLLSEFGLSYFKAMSSILDKSDPITFKRRGDDIYILASGSIVKDVSGGVLNLTESSPRVKFVNGDDIGQYYGYITPTKIFLDNVPSKMAEDITSELSKIRGATITGLSVNVKSNAFVLSFKNHMAPSNKHNGVNYTHIIKRDGYKKNIECDDDDDIGGINFKQSYVDFASPGKGIWISSYVLNPNAKTIVYLQGGPGIHSDDGNPYEYNELFKMGYNVDVVHYGGSNYTYDLIQRLNLYGLKSFESDAKNIEYWVKKNYSHKDSIFYAESFGAQIYPFMSVEGRGYFYKTILEKPSGSFNYIYKFGSDSEKERWKKRLGADLWGSKVNTKYYELNKSCQVRGLVLIVVGVDDNMVNPLYDYRNCFNNKNVIFYVDKMGHNATFETIGESDYRKVIIEEFLN